MLYLSLSLSLSLSIYIYIYVFLTLCEGEHLAAERDARGRQVRPQRHPGPPELTIKILMI